VSVLTKQTTRGATATDAQIAKIVPAAWQHTSHIDPSMIKPMAGRVIVRDIHEDDKDGRYASLVLPQNIEKAERRRLGVIVAVGEGDRWITMKERGPYGAFRCKGIKCQDCAGAGTVDFFVMPLGWLGQVREPTLSECTTCHGTGLGRLPMETKPGDRVIYDRRREAEIEIGGERYSLLYEEQGCLAIIDE
jgi:co-chaperonin GroES (HSP10)